MQESRDQKGEPAFLVENFKGQGLVCMSVERNVTDRVMLE